jgi:hypothetical protein
MSGTLSNEVGDARHGEGLTTRRNTVKGLVEPGSALFGNPAQRDRR